MTSPTILVVDDNECVRQVLEILLSQSFRVLCAASGEEASETYRERQAEITAVLLDVVLEGMDGVQTLRALKAMNPEVPCFLMSGYSDHYLVDFGELGADGFFPKPLDFQAIVDTFGRLKPAPGAKRPSPPLD